jgi:serine protease Do
MRKLLLSVALIFVLALAAFVGPSVLKQVSVPEARAQAPATQAAPPASADTLASLESAMETVYQNVSPSVVFIEVTQGGSTQSGSSQGTPRSGRQFGSQIPQQGSGSGFVWDKEGRIVTNNHVVDGATSINVTFADGTVVPAKVLGTDANSDLAVIQVSVSADKLQPVTLADSTKVKVGQIAIAIGNPFGLESTMTVGYVSGLGRSLPAGSSRGGSGTGSSYTMPDIIQTDAPINPGNSGGVLLNSRGEVLGVTNAIATNGGTSSGVGFAIPAATVAKVVPTLISGGHYAYSWLGISGTTLTPDLAQAMNLKSDQHGALVAAVVSGGPADKAGLKAGTTTVTLNGRDVQVGGDVIVAVDGNAINNFDALVAYQTRSTKPGQEVTLTILRGGQEQQVKVTLGERPAQQPVQ